MREYEVALRDQIEKSSFIYRRDPGAYGPHRWQRTPLKEFVDVDAYPEWYGGAGGGFSNGSSCLVDPHVDCDTW